MFKPGDIARVRADGRDVTVLADVATPFFIPEENLLAVALGAPEVRAAAIADIARRLQWPIRTTAGYFTEAELHPAHPTVLATAEGVGLDLGLDEEFDEEEDSEDDVQVGGALDAYLIQEEVAKSLRQASFDYNGHCKKGTDTGFQQVPVLLFRMTRIPTKDLLAVRDAIQSGSPLDRWVHIGEAPNFNECPTCGERYIPLETDGVTVRYATACPYPDGIPTTEWELNVPSGKLVVANDLRELFPLPGGDDMSVNHTLGCHLTTLAYAANGMAHAYVGNTCPSVYKYGEGLFKIVNPPYEEGDDDNDEPPLASSFEGEEVAGITTDLWWYSICDQDEFKLRCKHFKQKAKDFRVKVVDVKPGVYRFRHNQEVNRHGSGEVIHALFEWVRDPDPVKDYLTAYEEAEVNPHAYVQAQVARWPGLYGKVRTVRGKEIPTPWEWMTSAEEAASWVSVADRVFFSLGGGREWHEKGFPKATVKPGIPDIDPPAFRAQHAWYPFSTSHGVLSERLPLTPSFAKYAFRTLESVISFGMTVRDSDRCRDVKGTRERMQAAVGLYRELMGKYQGQADPEYVTWLSEEGRAEAWVRNFPLGPEYTERHLAHVARQRWVPEDAYAVALDMRKLSGGHFAWHPKKGGCWASKEDAQRYAILENGADQGEDSCCWLTHATNTSIPLYSIARVVKVGEVSHMGETLIEVAFDYGTPWMMGAGKRKAVTEAKEKEAITILTRAEYEAMLPDAIRFYEEAEASA